MASKKATHDMAGVLGDEFVADEILARLPARSAVRCTLLSKRFQQLLASPHFWLRHLRLGAPLELPHAARLYHHHDRNAFYFHVVGPTFSMEHAIEVDDDDGYYASTCNGLVLVSGTSYSDRGQSSVDGVVFNPATKEEACMSLQLSPHPGRKDVERRFLGFGYGPSSRVYKALIREDVDDCTRLMVVSLDGSGGQEPRTVFSSHDDLDCVDSLHTADGKVYFLIYAILFANEERHDVDMVLCFDVDNEVVTTIAIPEGPDISLIMMVEVHGRPCIFMKKDQDTMLWLLTKDNMWEHLYTLINEIPWHYSYLNGACDCGGGLLFTKFSTSHAYLYNLNEVAGEDKERGGRGTRLAHVSSVKIEDKRPERLQNMWIRHPSNLWGYQPTLISPATIFGDATSTSLLVRESVAPTHEFHEIILEENRKSIINPAMQMLSGLGAPFRRSD